VDDPIVRGSEVDPALGRAVKHQPGPADSGGQPLGRGVLVDVPRLDDEDRDARRRQRAWTTLDPDAGPSKRRQICRTQPTTLGPALSVHDQVAGEDRSGQVP
jgi:hypothetical protein